MEEMKKDTLEQESETEESSNAMPYTWIEEETDEDEWKTHTWNKIEEDETSYLISYIGQMEELIDEDNEIWINAKTNLAMDLAIKENLKKEELPVMEIVPEEYHKFLDVFNKEKAN